MNQLQQYDIAQSDLRNAPVESPITARDVGQVVWRHLWLIILIIVVSTGTATLISKHTPKAWRASGDLLLVQRSSVMATSAQAATTAPMIESIDTQISLLQSHNLAEMAAESVGISADQLQGVTEITEPKEGDNVIEVDVVANSRQQSIDWDNAILNSFVQYKQDVAQRNSLQTLYNLQQQAAIAKKQMVIDDAQLLDFQKTHTLNGVTVLDEPTQKTAALNSYLSQNALVSDLQNQYATAEARETIVQNQLHDVNNALRNGSSVRDDSAVVGLQEQVQSLQMQRQQIAQRYTAKFPGKLSIIDQEIADTQKRLHDAIQGTLGPDTSLQSQGALEQGYYEASTDAETLKVKLGVAIQQRDALQKATESLPQISMLSDKLTQNAADSRALYSALNDAVQSATLDQDVASGDVQVSQPAFAPNDPFTPNHKRDIALGFGVGVFLSLVAVLLLEQGDRSVRSPSDVRKLLEGPVIAVLSNLNRSQWARFLNGEHPPHMVETYNGARANLTLALQTNGTKGADYRHVILVSSSVAGEGKSLTASEIAQSYARAGKKVALVNADMRRPSSIALLHAGQFVKPGFAEILAGDATVEQSLFFTDVPNLMTIHSGVPKRNPVDLISSPAMARTMRTLRRLAEIVIIDSPPAVMVADALLLASHVDSVLYVVGVGMVDADTVRTTAASLAAATPRPLAYFVNKAPKTAAASPYYRHYGQPSFETGDVDEKQGHRNGHKPATASLPLTEGSNGATSSSEHPIDIAAPSSRSKPRSGASVNILAEGGTKLVSTDGPYKGQDFVLASDRTLSVGALPNNDFSLSRDVAVEPMHAFIVPEAAGYVLYDAGSARGTSINGELTKRKVLEIGDIIEIGASKFRYE